MDKTDKRYQAYLDILREELVPAMGCTEPVAVAYAAARARDVLGERPDHVRIAASSNILKNAKSAVVPNTGKLRGMEAAAAAGIVAGRADKVLEVISTVNDVKRREIRAFLDKHPPTVQPLQNGLTFDLIVTVSRGASKASVRIAHYHSNIVLITKDDAVLYRNQDCEEMETPRLTDRSVMNVKDILKFAECADMADVKDLLRRQIEYNTAIAAEGLKGDWGANIGSVLLETWGTDIKIRAKAMAAAAADARMSGCELPVVIVSGSGNQGIAASVPVVEYAAEMNADGDALYRALIVSNLVTIHQKTGIGRLSAYCGAVSAGVGAGAGITWLHGGRFVEIAHTIVNALATVSGIICDGAKPSCAAKIAAAVDAGLLGFYMYRKGQQFYDGDGIVKKGVENTIANIGRLGRDGMRETDREIISMMLGQ